MTAPAHTLVQLLDDIAELAIEADPDMLYGYAAGDTGVLVRLLRAAQRAQHTLRLVVQAAERATARSLPPDGKPVVLDNVAAERVAVAVGTSWDEDLLTIDLVDRLPDADRVDMVRAVLRCVARTGWRHDRLMDLGLNPWRYQAVDGWDVSVRLLDTTPPAGKERAA